MKPIKITAVLFILVFQSCSYRVFDGPYTNSQSDCGKLILKHFGKAELTKCGEIMWTVEGSWKKEGDTISVYFRNAWDNRKFLDKKGKLYRLYGNNQMGKRDKKVIIED